MSDTLGNNITVFEFAEPNDELIFTFQFRGIHYGGKSVEQFPLAPRAEEVPVQYTPDEWTDLSAFMRPHAEDDDSIVAAWAKNFVTNDQDRTTDVLQRMLDKFQKAFSYNAREAEGTQEPAETLRTRSGNCRDFAWLMIEALRRLGFASRFVSGYLYDGALDSGEAGTIASGGTHAWVQVYLPGAGWVHYDPTNRITAGYDLIPVAIARHPRQANPLLGSWLGNAQDYLGMTVNVAVHKLGNVSDPSEEFQ